MQGTSPYPMNIESLKRHIEYGRNNGGSKIEIKCHRCGSTTEEQYCALDTTSLDTDIISLECIDCLVEVLIASYIEIDQVTGFIDNRYIGAKQASLYIRGWKEYEFDFLRLVIQHIMGQEI